jgi:hypothetical protein
MIDGFTDAQVIGGLIALLAASYTAFFAWLVAGINRLDRKIDLKIDALDRKIDLKIDALHAELGPKLDALTIAVSRLEGAVYHGLPEPRRAVSE